MTAETEEQRRKREQQRSLFDGVARLYDATRQGYPTEIVDAIFTTAAIGRGAAVLEIGCGTGQLTRQLAGRALNLTAIDIGEAMTETTHRNVADPRPDSRCAPSRTSLAADPSISSCRQRPSTGSIPPSAWPKPPGGWLALLTTGERYREPLRTQLRDLWSRHSRQASQWARQPTWLTALRETTLFGPAVEVTHTRDLRFRPRQSWESSAPAPRSSATASTTRQPSPQTCGRSWSPPPTST